MERTLVEKKFRFVMIIAALALFVTILTPAYIRYGNGEANFPRVIMMWNVLFGGTKAKFEFSWFAFAGYLIIIPLLIISLLRNFIKVENKDDKKKKTKNGRSIGSIVLDVVCMICSFISLLMFILLPIFIGQEAPIVEYLVDSYYGWGLSYILAYIILVVMFVSSLIVVYSESFIKIMNKIKNKEKTEQKVEEQKEEKTEE